MNNALSLINDNWYRQTYLATINFQTAKISYQKAFPLIIQMTTAVFSSPTVYYAGGFYHYFYTNQENNMALSPYY